MEGKADLDLQETQEWLDALDGVLVREGPERAHFLIEQLIERARRDGTGLPFSANTPYVNTIPVALQPPLPGDFAIEQRIRHYIRWNAMAMVVRANRGTNVGGHIASFSSAAMLYDIGYNHFWRSWTKDRGGDLLFIQGHSAPGIYARAYLLGLVTEEQLTNFRQEVSGNACIFNDVISFRVIIMR